MDDTDWNVQTTVSLMNDDGINGDLNANDGIFTYKTVTNLPAANYEYKIVLNNNWVQNTSGANLQLHLTSPAEVSFYYDMSQNICTAEIYGSGSADETVPKPKITLTNYPNPFNPATTISFDLGTEKKESVKIEIYNVKGQKIKTFSNLKNRDVITWNGKNEKNKPVSSGIYLYKLLLGKQTKATHKCLLLK